MKIQMDVKVRVVALTNLIAMCKRISGTCHTFEVIKQTANRVQVEYSNPDEYGYAHPIVAEYPAYPLGFDDEGNLSVVLHAVRYLHDEDGYGYQAFDQLVDCPELGRQNMDSDDWRSAFEWLVEKHPKYAVTSTWDEHGVIQTWHCLGQQFRSWREAQDWAVNEMRKPQAA